MVKKEQRRSDTCEVLGVTAVLRAATAVAVAPRNGVIGLIDLATDGASGAPIRPRARGRGRVRVITTYFTNPRIYRV